MRKLFTDMHGVVALVLAVGVSAAIITATAVAAIKGHEFTNDETTLLSTIIGAMVGAVATYLGSSLSNGNGKDKDDT